MRPSLSLFVAVVVLVSGCAPGVVGGDATAKPRGLDGGRAAPLGEGPSAPSDEAGVGNDAGAAKTGDGGVAPPLPPTKDGDAGTPPATEDASAPPPMDDASTPPPVDDAGAAPPPCIEGGLYCGGDGVAGDASTLYVCVGGAPTVRQICANGCTKNPAGVSDACAAAPTTSWGADAVARALKWVDAAMPYCGGPNGGTDLLCGGTCSRTGAASDPTWDPYRSDCSGLVSFAWGLPAPGRVTSGFAPFDTSVSKVIDTSDLQPGDALNDSDHVMLFAGWVDAANGKARILEEYNCGHIATDHVLTLTLSGSSVFISDWSPQHYTAIRFIH